MQRVMSENSSSKNIQKSHVICSNSLKRSMKALIVVCIKVILMYKSVIIDQYKSNVNVQVNMKKERT